MSAIEARCDAVVVPNLMRDTMVNATVLPITPEGMPVRGGAGEITVPLGLVRGREIG
jgi:hypothetical protein